jgi:hypothetical protein
MLPPLTEADALQIIRNAEPDLGAELPDRIVLDVIRRTRSGESPSEIGSRYATASKETPAYTFLGSRGGLLQDRPCAAHDL